MNTRYLKNIENQDKSNKNERKLLLWKWSYSSFFLQILSIKFLEFAIEIIIY
jgi:hypothetical protein